MGPNHTIKALLTLLPLSLLAGCVSTPDPIEIDREPQPLTWSCPSSPGAPPQGELVAERIPGTATTRSEAGLFEGPVWIGDALYFSDFTFEAGFPSRIQRLDANGTMRTVIDNSGSNGLAVDNDGYLVAATHDRKEISRFNPYTGTREHIVGRFAGNPFNSPNDLTVTREGVIYFTDPDFQRGNAIRGQAETRVYRVEGGEVTVVDSSLANPNGVSLSPDQDVLYVVGDGEDGVLRAYPIVNGMPQAGEDIAQVVTPDGMAIDCHGNIYVAEHIEQRVRVFTPSGEEIAIIRVDANVTNPAFGGPDRRTLYITGAGTLWQLELDVEGFPY